MACNSDVILLESISSKAVVNFKSEGSLMPLRIKKSPSNITDLPSKNFQAILSYLSFQNIAKIRLVSRHFNNVCSNILNSEFNNLREVVQQKFANIKAQMPRRESSRRKHPLAQECDIMETLFMRLTLLNMTFGKHIERKYCCFFAGEILDEIHKILKYVENTSALSRAYKVTDELFDLSTMAMEYFKENIESGLPEVTYFASDVFEYPSFSSTFIPLAKSHLSVFEEMNGNPSKDSLSYPISSSTTILIKRIKELKERAKRQSKEISRIKTSTKSLSQKMSSLEECLHQLKWQQKNSKGTILPGSQKMNEVLYELNLYKHEINLLSSKLPEPIKIELHSEIEESNIKPVSNESTSMQKSHNIDSVGKKPVTKTSPQKRSSTTNKYADSLRKKKKPIFSHK